MSSTNPITGAEIAGAPRALLVRTVFQWFYGYAWFELIFIVLSCIWFAVSVLSNTDEPRLRVVQWHSPVPKSKKSSRLQFRSRYGKYFIVHPLKWVNRTHTVEGMYVNSISEYAGARGTTANKLLLVLATSCAGIQCFLAIGMHILGLASLARTWTLIAGGIACLLMGTAESAWKWTDVASIEQQMPDKPQPSRAVSNTEQQRSSDEQDDNQSKGEHRVTVEQSTDDGNNDSNDGNSSSNTDNSNGGNDAGKASSSNDGSQDTAPQSDNETANKQDDSSNDASQQKDENVGRPVDGGEEKARRKIVHTFAALALVHCNVVSEAFLWQNALETSLVVIGWALFWAFSVLQFLSGGYDSILPRQLLWCRDHFIHQLYMPQNTSKWAEDNLIRRWNHNKTPSVPVLGRVFLGLEMLSLLLLIAAVPIEVIHRWHTMTY